MFGLSVNLPVADTIYPQSDKFAAGVKIEATGESKLMTAQLFYHATEIPVLDQGEGPGRLSPCPCKGPIGGNFFWEPGHFY